MLEANVTFRRRFTDASVPRRLRGSFEPGRRVYGGIHEPGTRRPMTAPAPTCSGSLPSSASASSATPREVLRPAVRSPRHEAARFGEIATLDAAATLDDDAAACTVVLVNRSPDQPVAVTVALPSGSWRPDVHGYVESTSPGAVNTAAQPEAVRARTASPPVPQEGQLTVAVPPASWHLLRYTDRAA